MQTPSILKLYQMWSLKWETRGALKNWSLFCAINRHKSKFYIKLGKTPYILRLVCNLPNDRVSLALHFTVFVSDLTNCEFFRGKLCAKSVMFQTILLEILAQLLLSVRFSRNKNQPAIFVRVTFSVFPGQKQLGLFLPHAKIQHKWLLSW